MIRFVTTNIGKVRSLEAALEPYDLRVEHIDEELTELQVYDVDAIAQAKAREAFDRYGPGVLVQDSGFELAAWPQFPGAYAKFITETIGNPGILRLVDGLSRHCRWRTVWAYHDGSGIATYEKIEKGLIAVHEAGSLDENTLSSLWRIYIPIAEYNPKQKTLAQFDSRELAVHRARASNEEFTRWIVERAS